MIKLKILFGLLLVASNCQSQVTDSSIAGISQGKFIWKTPTQVRAALNLSNLYQPIGTYITPTGSTAITNKTIATFNYAADGGASDSYVITLSPAPAAYTTGMIVFFKANTVNTGAASINVNSLGVKTIVKRVSTVLATGDIPALSIAMVLYDGTNFVLLNPVVN